MKKRFNLYYILRDDRLKNPMRNEAKERISKILTLFFAKEKVDVRSSEKRKPD